MNPDVKALKQLLQLKESAIKQLMCKLAEVSEDAEMLAEEVVKKENELAEKASEAVEKTVETATEPATAEAIPEETKDLLVETMSNIDPDLASELSDEIDKAEETDKGVTAEKLATAVISVLNAYTKKAGQKSFGSIKMANKNVRPDNSWEASMGATLDKLLKDY
jgi:hypothetical protein